MIVIDHNIGMALVACWLISVIIGIVFASYCMKKSISEQEYNNWYWRSETKTTTEYPTISQMVDGESRKAEVNNDISGGK